MSRFLRVPFPLVVAAALFVAVPAARRPLAADGGPPAKAPASPRPAPGSSTAVADPLLLGTFPLPENPASDGDTLRMVKPAPSVRVLGVDAEEVFHGKAGDADKKRADEDFAAYAREKRGTSKTPVKYGTPAGLAAKAFAVEFFKGVPAVRLERDEAGRDADGFGRTLAHVFATKNGKDVLFAEALVRAGLSPYSVKYGRSRRFDARFLAAQKDAQEKKLGIWGDAVKHYPDYEERLAWWEERAKQVDAWDAEFRGKEPALDHVRLGVRSETSRLEGLLGRRVTLFGSIERFESDASPRRLLFVDASRDPFPVVVLEDEVWRDLDFEGAGRRFARISGTLTEHQGHLQIVLKSADDLVAK